MKKPEPPTVPETATETTQPKRTRSKPGTHNVFVTVSDEFYAKLEKSADGRPVNVWLSRLVERTTFPELEGEKKIGE